MQDSLNSTAFQPSFNGEVAGIPGAFIREVAALPKRLSHCELIGPHTEAGPGVLLFGVPGIARYLVRGGTLIEVAVDPGADRAAAWLVLHESARGTLIHQRGELALNAVTLVSPQGIGVAICGSSAAGKSTLAGALIWRGWRLAADGLVRVTCQESAAVACPNDTSLQLWRDACETAGLNVGELRKARQNLERYCVPVPSAREPFRLDFAISLRVSSECRIAELPEAQRAEFFGECTFRPRQLDALQQRRAHAQIVSRISRTCRAMILDGARERPPHELADTLVAATRLPH
jgi:hypothetical protein